MPDKQYENLVFEGGGVRGVAYAGALKVLEERDILPGISRVAGSSAGAFVALLLSLGYSSDELLDALHSLRFKTLEDKPNPVRIATHYGLYKGEVLYTWIADQVTKKDLSLDVTFAELDKLGGRKLHVFATDLSVRNVREFSATTTPDASVVGAVRASMSIPLMYAAWQFPNGIPDTHYYVDGGTVYNYPINAFDDADGACKKTLGFCFEKLADNASANVHDISNLFDFAKGLFSTLLSAQTIDFEQNPEQLLRSVRIDDLGFKATDLELSDQACESLYQSGYLATRQFLEKRAGNASA